MSDVPYYDTSLAPIYPDFSFKAWGAFQVHEPKEWKIVSNKPLILVAMCVCNYDGCHYTTSPHEAVNTYLNPTGHVKVNP